MKTKFCAGTTRRDTLPAAHATCTRFPEVSFVEGGSIFSFSRPFPWSSFGSAMRSTALRCDRHKIEFFDFRLKLHVYKCTCTLMSQSKLLPTKNNNNHYHQFTPASIYWKCVKSGHVGFVLVDAQAPGLQAPDSVGLARKSQADGFACGGKGGRGPWR